MKSAQNFLCSFWWKITLNIWDDEDQRSKKNHDLDNIIDNIKDKTKVIFITNPNNPTGTLLSLNEITSFLNKVRKDIIVVIAEAYIEVIYENRPDTISLLDKYENVKALPMKDIFPIHCFEIYLPKFLNFYSLHYSLMFIVLLVQ